jgi:hypothetical protein
MTYGRERFASETLNAEGADVSHLAELVRGDFYVRALVPSSGSSCRRQASGLTGHLLPRGRRAAVARLEFEQR